MSRRSRTRAVKARMGPAPAQTQAVTFTASQVQALLQGHPPQAGQLANPLPRPAQWATDPFAPGIPLRPAPINVPRPDTGRAEPRLFELPISTNINIGTAPYVPWRILQEAANMPLFRKCIERRKSVCQLDFAVIVDPKAVAREVALSGQAKTDVESALRRQYTGDIARISDWMQTPDRGNGYDWDKWTSLLMENRLKYDATCVYPRRTYGGDVHSFEVIDGKCYSDDTEVLTRRGWLRFADTGPDDEFATRNPKTQAFEWQQATYFHRERHAGDMIHFRSKCLDLLVTPTHRMLVTGLPRALGGSRHRGRAEAIIPAADLARHGGAQSKIPVTSGWDAPDLERFALAASPRGLPFACSGDDFAAFMGMWLSEGSLAGTDQVAISQKPQSKGFGPFRDLLARIFGREVCHTGTNFVIGRRCLHDYLAQFGKAHDKYVPALVKDMSARQLGIFWRFCMLGDGCYDGTRESIATVSERMAGDLQEIAQKMGCSASVRPYTSRGSVVPGGRVIRPGRCWIVRLSRTRARTWTAAAVAYDGEVFCVSVPNEILYVRRNGYAAWCGNTIKPLLDERGGRPLPPHPFCQQILYGFPRGEFIADAEIGDDGRPFVPGGFASDQLLYERTIIRPETPYGMSATEIALLDGIVWMRRMGWILAEYTEGVVPAALLEVDGATDWTVQQWQDWARALNDHLGGVTQERMKFSMLPPGVKAIQPAEVAERYRPDYDMFLLKLVAGDFGLTATELGFPEVGSLGASFHEGEEDVLNRVTRRPDSEWLSAVATRLCVRQMGMPNVLKIQILGLESEDEAAADAVAAEQVGSGRMTLNEDRARRGLPPYPFAEADMAMLETTRGVVFLDGASKLGPPGTMIGPPQAPKETGQPEPDDSEDEEDQEPEDEEPGQAQPGSRPKAAAASKSGEARALRTWLAKHGDAPSRPFECALLTAQDVPQLAGDPRVLFKAPPPKAPAGTGPAGTGTWSW